MPAAVEVGDGGLDVVTHQVELVARWPVGRVDGDLRRGQGEDQPAPTDVDVREAEHVPEGGPVGIGVVAVEDHVRAIDHAPET